MVAGAMLTAVMLSLWLTPDVNQPIAGLSPRDVKEIHRVVCQVEKPRLAWFKWARRGDWLSYARRWWHFRIVDIKEVPVPPPRGDNGQFPVAHASPAFFVHFIDEKGRTNSCHVAYRSGMWSYSHIFW